MKTYYFALSLLIFFSIQTMYKQEINTSNLREERKLLRKQLKNISFQLTKGKFTPENLACKSSLIDKILNNLKQEPLKTKRLQEQIKYFERIQAELNHTNINHKNPDAITQSRICEYEIEYESRKLNDELKKVQRRRQRLQIARAKLNERRKEKKEIIEEKTQKKKDISKKEKERIEQATLGKPLKDTYLGCESPNKHNDFLEKSLHLTWLFEEKEIEPDTINLTDLCQSQYIPKTVETDSVSNNNPIQDNRSFFSKILAFFNLS